MNENLIDELPKKSKVPLILFMFSILVFCVVIIWTSFHVSSLECTDLIYTTYNNGSVYNICDTINMNNAKNLIKYCERINFSNGGIVDVRP